MGMRDCGQEHVEKGAADAGAAGMRGSRPGRLPGSLLVHTHGRPGRRADVQTAATEQVLRDCVRERVTHGHVGRVHTRTYRQTRRAHRRGGDLREDALGVNCKRCWRPAAGQTGRQPVDDRSRSTRSRASTRTSRSRPASRRLVSARAPQQRGPQQRRRAAQPRAAPPAGFSPVTPATPLRLTRNTPRHLAPAWAPHSSVARWVYHSWPLLYPTPLSLADTSRPFVQQE
eukprot:366050-Chlamydomonas_euryale.AAC.11